jgi:exopolysaccharide biosynthesis polyprenyl glycosylphosphotransferase
MSAAWLGLCGLGVICAWLSWSAISAMCQEEIRTRMGRLPYAVLRAAALRIPRAERPEVIAEWQAELDFILGETDGLPMTRLLRGVRYSASLLGLLLPFARIRDLIAAYWWRKESRRLRSVVWVSEYVRAAVAADGICGLAAGLAAFQVGRGGHLNTAVAYLAVSVSFPLVWLLVIELAGGYDSRVIGAGPDEFRRIMAAGIGLTGSVAIFAWTAGVSVSRNYVLVLLWAATTADMAARYWLRKRLHRLRADGRCMQRVVVAGQEPAVTALVRELRVDRHLGLSVVAVCLARPPGRREVAGVPVYGGLDAVAAAVRVFAADTVAVLACPEMDGARLRELAWELEKSGTGLCVSPELLDVAGPRTTIRPTPGLALLHVDHPQLGGVRLVLKTLFDRGAAALALIVLTPLFGLLAAVIWLSDPGPVLFTSARIGKNGRPFRIFKFRTMVVDSAPPSAPHVAPSGAAQAFGLRKDPRVTAVGAYLRRWSIDELPQLINVVRGEMSLVGPRPALPEEAAKYADHVRRRLMVKPGLTGLWQVNGRSNLSWDESVRLDLRYVENWSFALDLQILWKTGAVLRRGSGAY